MGGTLRLPLSSGPLSFYLFPLNCDISHVVDTPDPIDPFLYFIQLQHQSTLWGRLIKAKKFCKAMANQCLPSSAHNPRQTSIGR